MAPVPASPAAITYKWQHARRCPTFVHIIPNETVAVTIAASRRLGHDGPQNGSAVDAVQGLPVRARGACPAGRGDTLTGSPPWWKSAAHCRQGSSSLVECCPHRRTPSRRGASLLLGSASSLDGVPQGQLSKPPVPAVGDLLAGFVPEQVFDACQLVRLSDSSCSGQSWGGFTPDVVRENRRQSFDRHGVHARPSRLPWQVTGQNR